MLRGRRLPVAGLARCSLSQPTASLNPRGAADAAARARRDPPARGFLTTKRRLAGPSPYPRRWLGAILGLDRGPEPKTRAASCGCSPAPSTPSRLASGTGSQLGHRARRRLGHAGRGRPRESVHWAQRSAAAKHFVARQKLCLPASVSYWVNALGGAPLLCLHKALDPKLVKAIEHDVVPHLVKLGVVPQAAPDLTPQAGAPALTLVSTARAGARTCSRNASLGSSSRAMTGR